MLWCSEKLCSEQSIYKLTRSATRRYTYVCMYVGNT